MRTDEYLKLINMEIVNDESELNKIIATLKNIFENNLFCYANNVIFVKDNVFTVINKSDLKAFVEMYFRDLFVLKENKKKELEEVLAVDVNKMFAFAKLNLIDNIRFVGVLDISSEGVYLDKKKKELIVKRSNLILPDLKFDIDEKIFNDVVKDYKNHFPLIDEFLDFVLACRFANNRKRSFLYLNAPSDWGKSFLMSIFKDLGLAIEVDYTDVVGGRPVGLSAMSVFKSLLMFLDEFTVFKKELKKITHSMRIEEKFKSVVEVDVYAKILMSAEKSVSFSDTIETQIANRVIFLEIKKDAKILTDRELYNKIGNYLYKQCVTKYVYEYLKQKITEYLELGIVEADKRAEQTLNKLYSKYKINEIDLETFLIKFVADELFYLKQISNNNEAEIDFEDKKLLKYLYFESEKVYINSFLKFIDELFKAKLDETKYKSASYKKSQLAQILFDAEKIRDILKQKKIDGVNKKVIEVDIRALNYKYLIKTKTFEFENYKIEFDDLEDLAIKINELVKDIYQMPNFREKLKDLKETIELYGLTRDFVIVTDEKGYFVGIELKKVKPDKEPNDNVPF
jgi:hypothetical protein